MPGALTLAFSVALSSEGRASRLQAQGFNASALIIAALLQAFVVNVLDVAVCKRGRLKGAPQRNLPLDPDSQRFKSFQTTKWAFRIVVNLEFDLREQLC